MIENIIITIPKKPDVNRELIIDLGTIFVGFLVSSDISAAASKPVKHHAPNKIDNAKDSNPISEILKSLVIFEIEKSSIPLVTKKPSANIKRITPIISVTTPMLLIYETILIPFLWIRVIIQIIIIEMIISFTSRENTWDKKSLKTIPRVLQIPGNPVRNCINNNQPVANPNLEFTSLDDHWYPYPEIGNLTDSSAIIKATKNCPTKTINHDKDIQGPTSEYPKWKFAKIPVKIDIKENDIAKDEKPFIDLFRSCLYPNFARSLESLSTLDWDMT